MNMKGFLLLLAAILLVFLALHLILRGSLNSRQAKEAELRASLAKLEEENRDMNNQLSVVGTKDYIVSSAMENFGYISRNDIRFSFSNPEALYAYSEEEIQILMDEMAE
jgi:cell division protein FtsB